MNERKTKATLMIAIFLISALAGLAIPVLASTPVIPKYKFDGTIVSTEDKWNVSSDSTYGNYVVRLDSADSYFRIYPEMSTPLTVDDITDIKFSWFLEEVTGDNFAMDLELLFVSENYDAASGNGSVEITITNQGAVPKSWHYDVQLDTWKEATFTGESVFVIVYGKHDNGTSLRGNVVPDGMDQFPAGQSSYYLSYFLDNITTAGYNDWELEKVSFQNRAAHTAVHVDNLVLGDVTYNLEPFTLDEEYYTIDSTVTVTVYNTTLNADPIRVDEHLLTATAASTEAGDSILFDLVEDGVDTGIFVGTFTVVDGSPAANELLIDTEDTITVTYGVDLTATVDTVAPAVTGMSPADGEIVNDNLTAIGVALSGHELAWMTVDGIVRDTAITNDNAMLYTVTDVDPLSEGEHTVVVIAEDTAGNVNTTSWAFTVDITKPTAEITMNVTSPVKAGDIELYADFSEGMVNASNIVFSDNLTDIFTWTVPAQTFWTANATYTMNATIGGDPYNGTAQVNVTGATDLGENEMVLASYTFYIDTVDPVAAPDNLVATEGATSVVLTWDASEDLGSGMASYKVYNGSELLETVTYPLTTYTHIGLMESTNLKYTVRAVDLAGNEAISDLLEVAFTPGEITEWAISLEAGWNLVSLPLIPTDSSIEVVLADILENVTAVWSYDETALDWASYDPDAPIVVNDLIAMVDGDGYWVNMTYAGTLTVHGVEMPEPPQLPPTYDLVAGWNLIGYKALEEMSATDYLGESVAADCIRIYGFDEGSYFGLPLSSNMVPGLGYWIAMDDAGTIYP